MAVVYPSSEVKVTIETGDGKVIDLTGVVVDMTISSQLNDYFTFNGDYIPGHRLSEYELTIRGTGAAFTNGEYVQRVHDAKQAPEWVCDYCGWVNTKVARYCGQDDHGKGCGAPRSFIYDV